MSAELSRRESEQQLFRVIEGSPIPTFVIGLNHKVLNWNRALEQLSRIPAKEVIGTNQHWRAFYAKERPCMADLLVDQSLETVPEWYRGVSRSKLLDETFEAEGFFPTWVKAAAGSGSLQRPFAAPGESWSARSRPWRISRSENSQSRDCWRAKRLNSIFQEFSIPAFVIGKDHKVILWNRALEKLTKI